MVAKRGEMDSNTLSEGTNPKVQEEQPIGAAGWTAVVAEWANRLETAPGDHRLTQIPCTLHFFVHKMQPKNRQKAVSCFFGSEKQQKHKTGGGAPRRSKQREYAGTGRPRARGKKTAGKRNGAACCFAEFLAWCSGAPSHVCNHYILQTLDWVAQVPLPEAAGADADYRLYTRVYHLTRMPYALHGRWFASFVRQLPGEEPSGKRSEVRVTPMIRSLQ